MTPLLGQTRTRVGARHALITPDGQVPSVVPGIERARVIAHITPAMGAGFTQSTLFFEPSGCAQFGVVPHESLLYVQEGSIEATLGGKTQVLTPGSYLYLPPEMAATATSPGISTVVLFQKKYVPPPGGKPPPPFLGHSSDIEPLPFLGNPKARLQTLLPDDPAFDLAVNIFTYQPGAALPFVETHVMEHGLLMLSGQGIYRLEDNWYPVTAGDVIWMAPYCPQWFAAIGDVPASYIYYKDINRPLLAP
jgi:(S)-ureidoglycine aminohydrolase